MAIWCRHNSLSVRLAESAVFLRTHPGRCSTNERSQPSLLRGLLVLDLPKPTRISSIELELRAKSSISWPEGFGASRLEITEEHTIFRASAVYFRAGQDPQRRPTSVGPGISFHAGYEDWDDHPHTPELLSPSPSRRYRRGSTDGCVHRPHLDHYDEHYDRAPPYSPFATTPITMSRATSPASSAFHSPLTPATDASISPVSDSRRSRSILPSVPELSAQLLHEQLTSSQNNLYDETDHQAESAAWSLLRSITPNHPRDSSYEGQDRSRSRFTLASMSNALLDAVWSRHGTDDNESRGRSRQKDTSNAVGAPPLRGRPLEKAVKDHERKPFGILTDFLKHEEHGVNWKEFKKGTYTYPISLSIPSNSPPTLHCNHGNVIWRLEAVVHRPGAFESKLIATREVIVVASPSDDDTENSENIVVERHWDQQLQYLISISGRSFYIGGTMPVSFTLMPLTKIKIHKIHVCIEERIDYYTQTKRISRTEPMRRIVLLDIKNEGTGDHILPLDSNDVNAFRNSPFYCLATPTDDHSEMASSLMGPGPWTFHQDLHLPHSCRYIHFTNRNKLSSISITHTLKWTIRLERGDDLHVNTKTGKRKLFDIVMQTPVHILSCRCNPDWIALPCYSEHLSDPHTVTPNCPCHFDQTEHTLSGMFRGPTSLERVTSEGSASSASSVEASVINSATMSSLRQEVPMLLQMTSQYERLVSGQETETGETPPAYVA
ncbi:hypothetical protein APHAL10511_004771 [Amanita phalloides]|nr:hypothetical protein APHAL10511_004771 [Amanita phalloides]